MPECVFCAKEYSGLGNNAMPVTSGRCCDKCHIDVILAELTLIQDRDYMMAVTE